MEVASSSTILPIQTIKALVDSGNLSSLPSQYDSRNPDSDQLEPVVEEDVPVIDFSSLSSENPNRRRLAVETLGKACREWGFFAVVNHGVAENMRENMIKACRQFFDMTEEEKRESAGTHVSDPIRYGTSFNTRVENVRYWRDYLKIICHPEFHSPSKPPGFREVAVEYTTSLRRLAMELLRGIWESLGLDEKDMAKTLKLGECVQVVAANLYPPCPWPEVVMGLPPHSDLGLLTILMQNGVQGLQIKHGRQWVRVKPLPDSFVVNIGDHMEIITNGRYKSILHRAEVNTTNTRISVATVIGPSFTAVVAPAQPLLNNEPAAYHPITFKDYFEMQQSSKLDSKSCLERLKI